MTEVTMCENVFSQITENTYPSPKDDKMLMLQVFFGLNVFQQLRNNVRQRILSWYTDRPADILDIPLKQLNDS